MSGRDQAPNARTAALQNLIDRRDIGAVLARHSRALDRADCVFSDIPAEAARTGAV